MGGYDGSEESDGMAGSGNEEGDFKLKFCTVCASNQNRYILSPLSLNQLLL